MPKGIERMIAGFMFRTLRDRRPGWRHISSLHKERGMYLLEIARLMLKPSVLPSVFSMALCLGAESESSKELFAAIRSNDLATLKTLADTGANQRGERD